MKNFFQQLVGVVVSPGGENREAQRFDFQRRRWDDGKPGGF